MPRTKRSELARDRQRFVSFTFRNKQIKLFLDRVLIFRLFRVLHGRFWGIGGISIMILCFGICFVIRPDLLKISTPLSLFATDVRTAPYFAAACFFGAYGLWRWRTYLAHTWKNSKLVLGLITLTMLGLYLVALFPVNWRIMPHYIHMTGVIIVATSIAATVVIDGLFTKVKARSGVPWRWLRFLSFVSIVGGGIITFYSTDPYDKFHAALAGEAMIIFGYWAWIVLKTYQGEGNTTILYRIAKKLVIISRL